MVGVNGAGMSKLALILKSLGFEVIGTDITQNSTTNELINKGIKFTSNTFPVEKHFDFVVVSSAIPQNHPSFSFAKEKQIPIYKRGEILAQIAKDYKSIVIAGTHGKTTTTSLIYTIMSRFYPSSIYVGGKIECSEEFKKNSNYFVIESDESDRTFMLFRPYILVATNIDKDHLNSYNNDFKELVKAFETVFETSQRIVYFFDDKNLREIGSKFNNTFSYSVESSNADLYASDIEYLSNGLIFSLFYKGNFQGRFFLPIFGINHLQNALASILVSKLEDIPIVNSLNALSSFRFPKRRFELKCELSGITLIDDHADHPTEVKATLDTIKRHYPGRRIVAIFEPHRFSRVNILKEEIAEPFAFADVVITKEIYPAFETPIKGVNGEMVFKLIKKRFPEKEVYFASSYDAILTILFQIVKSGDILVLLGPGEIYKVANSIIEMLGRKI